MSAGVGARDGDAMSVEGGFYSLFCQHGPSGCVASGHPAREVRPVWRAMIRLTPTRGRTIAMPWTKAAIASLASALAATVVLSACQLGSDPNAIKIYSSMPRTGASKGLTDSITNGIKMAFDEAGNKVGTYNIRYEDLDDATAAKGNWDA